MTRLTIDFGIDLGTTNSSIAVFDKHGPRVLRNNEGMEYTPSAVWIEKSGKMRVGSAAKDRLISDEENSAAEFKLWMGTTQTKTFLRTGVSLTPEEMSAEVLKSLRQDARKDTGEEIDSAVITVPAAFDQPQSEATRRAARLAGIQNSDFLQEPIAAGLAYGFQNEGDNVFWLVYDLGGGTFDAAVIHVRDGVMQVVHHGGDNNLGGKHIDWAIVDQLLAPSLVRKYHLERFHRGNKDPRIVGAFAKLKYHAEKAKVALSKDDTYDLPDEFICTDDSGETVTLEGLLTRTAVQSLAHAYFAKSINICRRVLAQKNLGANNIEKVLLVGGPTYTPYLRELLVDGSEGLGIPLESHVDPLTVVAQGAAIFAGSRQIPHPTTTTEPGRYTIELEYKPTGTDTEPLIGGRIISPGRKAFAGFTIRFTNAGSRPPWNSGNISLDDNGTFMTTLWAEKGLQNLFAIELFDGNGRKCSVSPDSLPYTVGLSITDPPLPHNIGVALANNEVDVFFQKGTPLPAKSRHIHKTIAALKPDNAQGSIRIPFVEGDYSEADLNRKIGLFEIGVDQVKREVPIGSEFEIQLEYDSSRILRGSIYVPILDMEFPLDIDGLVKPQPDVAEMKREFQSQKQKLREAQGVASTANLPKLGGMLNELQREDVIGSLERQLAASGDPEAARACENQLLDLRAALRHIEAQVRLPKLLAEAKDETEWARQAVEAHGTPEEHTRYELLRQELEKAISGDSAILEKKINDISQLRIMILARTPEYWIGFRDYLLNRQSEMNDATQAQLWFAHADRAIDNGDVEALKSACQQLYALLPISEQSTGYGGTTMRWSRIH